MSFNLAQEDESWKPYSSYRPASRADANNYLFALLQGNCLHWTKPGLQDDTKDGGQKGDKME